MQNVTALDQVPTWDFSRLSPSKRRAGDSLTATSCTSGHCRAQVGPETENKHIPKKSSPVTDGPPSLNARAGFKPWRPAARLTAGRCREAPAWGCGQGGRWAGWGCAGACRPHTFTELPEPRPGWQPVPGPRLAPSCPDLSPPTGSFPPCRPVKNLSGLWPPRQQACGCVHLGWLCPSPPPAEASRAQRVLQVIREDTGTVNCRYKASLRLAA